MVEDILKGSHEHFLIWMRDFYSFFIELRYIFSEGFRGALEEVEQVDSCHLSVFVGGEMLHHLPG